MDITVENITDLELPAELETALLAKLEPKISPYLTGKDFIVKPKSAYDTEFNAAVAAKNKEAIDQESAKLYGSIDNILKLLGMPKPEGQTSTRAHVLALAAEGKLPLTAEQMETMKKKLEAKGATEGQADDAIDKLSDEIEKLKKGDPEKDKAELQKSVKRAVDASLKTAPVIIDPNLKTDAEKTTAKNAIISDIKTLFNGYYEGVEDEDGNLGYRKKGTTEILMNATTNEPMTPLEIIQRNHSMFLAPAGHKQTGGGTGGAGGSGTATATDFKDILLMAGEKGLKTNTPAWHKFVNDEKKKAGIK